ncbi:MAG: hypothetical protein FJ206_04335 [Gemmatimonadetes bacterium]|nr:hypothetical protein [Gemmatimonadota bacterium]
MIESVSGRAADGVRARQGAGTPSPFREPAELQALGPLQFVEALAVVADWARGPLGKERVLARRPLTDAEAIRHELAPVGQLLALVGRGESVDVAPVPPLDSILGRLRVEGSVLSGAELVAVRQTLLAGRIVAGELKRLVPEAPAIEPLLRTPLDRTIEQRLQLALDDDGELLDTASPRLAHARRAIHEARDRLLKKLDTVLRGLDAHTVPAGAQVTVRGDRYVIPVRRDSRKRPDGIIHDESGSQGTLFVEPLAALESGNALRSAVADAEREALKVLRDLTELLRPAAVQIAELHEMAVVADDLVARVRYAHAVGGAVPVVGGDRLTLLGARHPLLLARGLTVVPFDLRFLPEERTLLISGPNAGGKTVLLKTVGLAILLTQAGVVPPLGAGSAFPVVTNAFADIGDHQSIAADLSTFSAHLVLLREVLAAAGGTTLVLIDEIGSGTDPAEGGALAGAALRHLTDRGALAVATTHIGVLKTLASEVPGVVNGSLEFDAERLQPTFRFRQGVPGRSYGLAIARRLGVDSTVVRQAEGAVPDRERALDELLAHVEERSRAVEAEAIALGTRAADLENREARASVTEESQHARHQELTRRERELERAGRKEARRYLLDARERVEAVLSRAKDVADHAAAREVRRELEEAAQAESAALERLETGERVAGGGGGALDPGQRVRLSTGGVGTVHEIRSDGRLVVALGAVKLVVESSAVVPVAGPAPKPKAPVAVDIGDRSAPTEIDLRGMRADEAAQVTLAALDAAILAEHPWIRLIHGMGTGAVRESVRSVLKRDRRVAKFDFAPRNQGGTGVTVVEFEDAS